MSQQPEGAGRGPSTLSGVQRRRHASPVPSVACVEEERKPRTQHVKRPPGTLEAGRVTAHPEVWDSLVKARRQTATVCTHRKPTRRHQKG